MAANTAGAASASNIALKEWAVTCDAIASGLQLVLFRKGGIHEGPQGFRPEHQRFWLFPTGFHQSLDGVRDEFRSAADQTLQNSPSQGKIDFQHFCTIEDTYWLDDEHQLSKLERFHILSEDAVLTRFRYRKPGLFVLTVQVQSLHKVFQIPALSQYDGCHSWVELAESLPITNLGAPLDSPQRQDSLAELRRILGNANHQPE